MRNFLKAGLALAFSAIVANAANAQTVYLVSNAHLDSQWNWDVKTTINEYVPATLYRNLALMEQYPDYVFNCESGIKYAWMKEYHPEAYSKLKTYIQEGRWHISGSCWEASDANIPSTESLTRNILYGQHFYESEFGVLSTDIFLPDCFGFGQELPTIAAHCGLLGFSTQKLQWRNNPFYGEAKEPFPFGKWRGVDGSEIYMALQVGKYSRKFQGEDLSESQELIAHAAKSPLNIGMFYYGTGDIGGSPTMPSVQSVVRGVNGNGPVKIISAASDQLFKDLQGKEVETWDDELLMDVHGTGCY
ncbi:MAG: alpha-mannosidase, partial [Bacteroidales bacterium]|nr:alpha-mannosidase [Bacteroidales bacterium]